MDMTLFREIHFLPKQYQSFSASFEPLKIDNTNGKNGWIVSHFSMINTTKRFKFRYEL